MTDSEDEHDMNAFSNVETDNDCNECVNVSEGLRDRGLDFTCLPVSNPYNTMPNFELGSSSLAPNLIRTVNMQKYQKFSFKQILGDFYLS